MEEGRNYKFDRSNYTWRLTLADLILRTMTDNSLSVWGFVLVRCTYASEAAWETFLADFKERALRPATGDRETSPAFHERFNTCVRWTVIEDREALEGASMPVASAKFKEWVETAGREELIISGHLAIKLKENEITFEGQMMFPRYKLFVYVDAAALETVSTEGQAGHGRGYQPALVHMWLSLNPPDPEEWARLATWPLEEEPDESFIRIDATEVVDYFSLNLDINDWYHGWQEAQDKIEAKEKIETADRDTTGMDAAVGES